MQPANTPQTLVRIEYTSRGQRVLSAPMPGHKARSLYTRKLKDGANPEVKKNQGT